MKLHTFHIGGIHPDEHKLTNEAATVEAPLPRTAVFLLQQHIGAPAKAVVKRGDKVKVGTLLAEAGSYVSAPVYSSVSGTVQKVDTFTDATGYRVPAIYVDVEGDEWEEYIDRSSRISFRPPRAHTGRDHQACAMGRHHRNGRSRLPYARETHPSSHSQG